MYVSSAAGEDREGGHWAEDEVGIQHLFSSSCQPNPYLFGPYDPPQDKMTLEFVAVLPEGYEVDNRFKICVVFYKQLGHCQEFATMYRR